MRFVGCEDMQFHGLHVFVFPNFAVVAFVMGIIYGLLYPGKENRLRLLKKAVGLGIILGIIVGLLSAIFLPGLLGILAIGASIFAFVIFILYFAIFFIIGTFDGDLIRGLLG